MFLAPTLSIAAACRSSETSLKLTNKDMVLQCMQRIEALQHAVGMLDQIKRMIYEEGRQKTIDEGNLRQILIDKELGEWRNVAMWGLTLSDDERDRVKAAVHQRFLRDDMHVAFWFNGGELPTSWMRADEDAFREMARKAFAPGA